MRACRGGRTRSRFYLWAASAAAAAAACAGDTNDDASASEESAGRDDGREDGGSSVDGDAAAPGGGEGGGGTSAGGAATGGRRSPGGAECGNGVVDDGEECDDANDVAEDGCESNCLFTCLDDTDCTDRLYCTGEERCTSEHTCEAGTPPPDGELCGQYQGCLDGECVAFPDVCGDGDVAIGEECDDGNDIAGDGCENDCRFTCVIGSQTRNCASTNPCVAPGECVDNACITGATLPDGVRCGSAAECTAGACSTVYCGNGTTDPGEQCDDGNLVSDDACGLDCQPPGSTCTSNCTVCDLTGTWGVRTDVNVVWPSDGPVLYGTGTVTGWFLATRTQSGLSTTDQFRVCGIASPDTHIKVQTIGSPEETYGLLFPDALFDSASIPTFTVSGGLTDTVPGATFVTDIIVGQLGIDLDDPLDDSWPTAAAASSSSVDHDADGNPGVTVLTKNGNGYIHVAAEFGRDAARASQLYMAFRQISRLEGTVESCDRMSGPALVATVDSVVLGCQLASGGECDGTMTAFIGDGQPDYTPTSATWSAQRLSNSATCTTVRSALP